MTHAVKFTRCLEWPGPHLLIFTRSCTHLPRGLHLRATRRRDACCSLLDFGHLYLAMLFMAICAMLATFAHHDSAICNCRQGKRLKAPFRISDSFLCHLWDRCVLGQWACLLVWASLFPVPFAVSLIAPLSPKLRRGRRPDRATDSRQMLGVQTVAGRRRQGAGWPPFHCSAK